MKRRANVGAPVIGLLAAVVFLPGDPIRVARPVAVDGAADAPARLTTLTDPRHG